MVAMATVKVRNVAYIAGFKTLTLFIEG